MIMKFVVEEKNLVTATATVFEFRRFDEEKSHIDIVKHVSDVDDVNDVIEFVE